MTTDPTVDNGRTDDLFSQRNRVDKAIAINRVLNEESLDEPRTDSVMSRAARRINLPNVPIDLPMPLTDALWQRRSRYSFAPRPLALDALSGLLRLAVGVQRYVEGYGSTHHPLGLAPTAGGLPSLLIYVAARSVRDLASGVYRYEPVGHSLDEISTEDSLSDLGSVYVQPEFAEYAPVTLAITAHLGRTMHKYPLRHYRTVHVDTGIAVQNLYLISAVLNLSCCAVAGFRDQKLADFLQIPREVIPTMLFAVGHRP